MNELQDTRIAKLPKWARREFETKERTIRHLQSAILDYEGHGESRISYTHSGHGSKRNDRFLPEHSSIEWKLKSGTLVRLHETMEGPLAISTEGQLTMRPKAGNWIEIL